MKDLTVSVEDKFSPIKVSFTLTSRDELNELWCRLNIASSKVYALNAKNTRHRFMNNNFHELWRELDRLSK